MYCKKKFLNQGTNCPSDAADVLCGVALEKICSLSRDLRFDELRRVLESYGYTMNAPRSGSSHYTFRKPGCQPITIPKHEPIKKVYVEMVKQIVESEGANENVE